MATNESPHDDVELGEEVTRDTRAGLERLAGDLQRAGARVERCSPAERGFDFAMANEVGGSIFRAEVASVETTCDRSKM